MKARRTLAGIGGLICLLALAACGSAQGTTAPRHAVIPVDSATASVSGAGRPASGTEASCSTEAAETMARTAGSAAMRIYANELASPEVFADKRQVETYGPLLSALESNSQTAIRQAVTSLVYSHTHVVRLRVTRGSQVLADIGGPYIIAPVHGVLRRNGRTLAQYVLSVQDDLGYVKLESRFVGVPVVLSEGGRPLAIEGALSPAPGALPAHGPVSYRGTEYQTFSFDAKAFPTGVLRVSLLVPVQGARTTESCSAVKAVEVRHIAERMWQRFASTGASIGSFAGFASGLTGAQVYVRAGAHQVAASSLPGPSKLPANGTVTYRGSRYSVGSFSAHAPAGRVRVYLLVHA